MGIFPKAKLIDGRLWIAKYRTGISTWSSTNARKKLYSNQKTASDCLGQTTNPHWGFYYSVQDQFLPTCVFSLSSPLLTTASPTKKTNRWVKQRINSLPLYSYSTLWVIIQQFKKPLHSLVAAVARPLSSLSHLTLCLPGHDLICDPALHSSLRFRGECYWVLRLSVLRSGTGETCFKSILHTRSRERWGV